MFLVTLRWNLERFSYYNKCYHKLFGQQILLSFKKPEDKIHVIWARTIEYLTKPAYRSDTKNDKDNLKKLFRYCQFFWGDQMHVQISSIKSFPKQWMQMFLLMSHEPLLRRLHHGQNVLKRHFEASNKLRKSCRVDIGRHDTHVLQ